jgi:hypothetical protein
MDALPSPPPGGWALAHATPGALRRAVGRAGLQVIGSGTVTCLYSYPDGDAAWRAHRSAGPLQAALQVIDEAALEMIVRRALAPFHHDTGGVRLEKRFHYVVAVPRATVRGNCAG